MPEYQKIIYSLIGFLVALGFDVSGYKNPTLAIVLWVIAFSLAIWLHRSYLKAIVYDNGWKIRNTVFVSLFLLIAIVIFYVSQMKDKTVRYFQISVHDTTSEGNNISGITQENGLLKFDGIDIKLKLACKGQEVRIIKDFIWEEVVKGIYEVEIKESIVATPEKSCNWWVDHELIKKEVTRIVD